MIWEPSQRQALLHEWLHRLYVSSQEQISVSKFSLLGSLVFLAIFLCLFCIFFTLHTSSYLEPRNTWNFLTPPITMVLRGRAAQASFSKGLGLVNIRSLHCFKVINQRSTGPESEPWALVLTIHLSHHEAPGSSFPSLAAIGSSVEEAAHLREWHLVLFPFLIVWGFQCESYDYIAKYRDEASAAYMLCILTVIVRMLCYSAVINAGCS